MAANPRAAAVAALVRKEQDGFSNLVLDAELKRQQLEGRDKAFASAIFYTVLEHRGTLDYILCQFLPKGLAKLDAPVREILRAALAQARYMQVPVSAADPLPALGRRRARRYRRQPTGLWQIAAAPGRQRRREETRNAAARPARRPRPRPGARSPKRPAGRSASSNPWTRSSTTTPATG